MNEYDLRFDLSSELQNFYEKNKDKESIRDWNETLKKSKKIFQVNFHGCFHISSFQKLFW
jgi:hypothetical protein